jgi:serine/threonine-protein kinase
MVGQIISHYEILNKLGEGGMGVVYLARDLRLNRRVALKFLPPQFFDEDKQTRRLVQEAQAASSLDHPNICTIHEIGTSSNNQLFIAMSFYEGQTVREKVKHGPLSKSEAVEIAEHVLSGLARAHSQGIVHRDIKPANIMVTAEGIVKILDFGLAKFIGQGTIGEPGHIVGTLAYMSPEQLEGDVDCRTDLWSTGVLLYEMLTGQVPFDGDSTAAVMHNILHGEYRNLRCFRPELPFDLDRVVYRALEKNRDLRYASANQMISDLRHVRAPELSATVSLAAPFEAPEMYQQRQGTPSIAVLPFADLSQEQHSEYFSDGLAEELIHALSQLKGLRVVSRTSTFEFKGKAQDIRKIAQRLGVTTVLEGSVRRAGDKLRVTVLLTNAADGYNIWSRRFDSNSEDVFAIQEEIATSVAKLLLPKQKSETRVDFANRYSGNPEAWNLYLRGRYYWNKATEEAYQKARFYFQQAVDLDTDCAPAYAGLADYYRALAFWGFVDPRQAWPLALQYAIKALALDPTLPQAHIALARYAQQMGWDRDGAEKEFRRAIDLNPSHSEAHFAWCIFLLQTARFDEALSATRVARELDPLNLAVNTSFAWLHCYREEYDQAVVECKAVLELEPGYFEALCCMAMILEKQGQTLDAESWWEKGLAASGSSPLVYGFLGRNYALNAKLMKAREILTTLDAMSQTRYVSPVAFAFIHTSLANLDTAIEFIEKGFEAHDAMLSYALVFPPFDPLRGDVRFKSILRRMGLSGLHQSQVSGNA